MTKQLDPLLYLMGRYGLPALALPGGNGWRSGVAGR
jgi:hypothetical protein